MKGTDLMDMLPYTAVSYIVQCS